MTVPNLDYEMFLYMSFIPNFAKTSLEWFFPDQVEEFGRGIPNESWWIDEGVKTFKQTMADEFASTHSDALHVVPLSGGLDSRLILGGLLELLPASQIVAATYGIPGSWDLEIASAIARKFGLRHVIFDLTEEKWDRDRLIEAGRHLKEPVSVHQSYIRQKITNHFGEDCVYWSGFMGDVLAGSSLPKVPSTDKRKAIKLRLESLITRNYRDQAFQDQVIDRIIAECPWEHLAQSKLTLDQQLLIGIQQLQRTRPIVLTNGFVFKTPFLNKRWVNYSLNIPYKWLYVKYLYRRIIHAAYRELAKFPTSASAGMPAHTSVYNYHLGRVLAKIQPYILWRDPYFSHPRTNYINWTASLRHRGSFQDMILADLDDLRKRAIFDAEEIDTWWNDHQTYRRDNTFILLNLSNLELLFKAGVLR